MNARLSRLYLAYRRLRADTSGLAFIEFALTMPIIIAAGGWGAELSYVSLTNMRVSQYALNLADTVSRLGTSANGGVVLLREADVDDAFQGVRLSGAAMKLGTFGRVTLSSLETTKQNYDAAYVQRIHWQRCFGQMTGSDYESSYSTSLTAGTSNKVADAGTPAPSGLGDTSAGSATVNAPRDNAVMYVEINYQYQPLFGTLFVGPRILHYTASMLVRDNRDYTQIYNPSPTALVATCDKHTT